MVSGIRVARGVVRRHAVCLTSRWRIGRFQLCEGNCHERFSFLARSVHLAPERHGVRYYEVKWEILCSFDKDGVHHDELYEFDDTSEQLCSEVHEDHRFESLVSDFRSC